MRKALHFFERLVLPNTNLQQEKDINMIIQGFQQLDGDELVQAEFLKKLK